MAKFDAIRMADLTEVQDPDKDGGITLVFKDNKAGDQLILCYDSNFKSAI